MEAPLVRPVLEGMSAVLRPIGYQREKQVFRATHGELLHFVGLQSSGSSTAQRIQVTVNVGVYSLPLAEALGESLADSPRKPGVLDCHWQQRIGQLMPAAEDTWWTAATAEDAERIGIGIADALRACVLPRLASMQSAQEFHAWLAAAPIPFLADTAEQGTSPPQRNWVR